MPFYTLWPPLSWITMPIWYARMLLLVRTERPKMFSTFFGNSSRHRLVCFKYENKFWIKIVAGQHTADCVVASPWLSGFVFAYPAPTPGSNPPGTRSTLFSFIVKIGVYLSLYGENKKEARFGPYFKKHRQHMLVVVLCSACLSSIRVRTPQKSSVIIT